MKLYILTLFVAASMSAQTKPCNYYNNFEPCVQAVRLPQPYRNEWKPTVAIIQLPRPAVAFGKPLPKVVILPQPPEAVMQESKVVHLDNWNGVHEMWTPKPSVVFIDEPLERIASRHEGYERIGYKFYRRIAK